MTSEIGRSSGKTSAPEIYRGAPAPIKAHRAGGKAQRDARLEAAARRGAGRARLPPPLSHSPPLSEKHQMNKNSLSH